LKDGSNRFQSTVTPSTYGLNSGGSEVMYAQVGGGFATGTLQAITYDLSNPDASDLNPYKLGTYGAIGLGIGGHYLYTNKDAIIAKMNKEIEGIRQKVGGPPRFVYALVATRSGSYPNLNTGETTHLNVGDVWKYGQTTQGDSRYPDAKINPAKMGLKMEPIFFGNQMEIKIHEKIMIYEYFFRQGHRPPGNSIFR
jgi:hypothetical protein